MSKSDVFAYGNFFTCFYMYLNNRFKVYLKYTLLTNPS